MTVHKLTAGDGYIYLTRQVAASDATNRGYDNLGAYYEEKGESPGVWLGSGMDTVPDFRPQDGVSEAQMIALFGEGRHPNAVQIEHAALAAGKTPWQVAQSSRFGSPYLIHEQANMFNRRSAGAYRDYNAALGLPAGTPVPAEERSRMRTELASEMFVETYGRRPVDSRELSGHLARISRQATTAVAGYDLSFSPVKSVSTLWAVAPRQVAQIIEQAHHDAVKDTVTWLEDHATYTRRGKHGVAQVDVHGLIGAAFTHRDSRAGDPDLHTHVAISNKVQALDGKWLALDGRPIYKNNVAASERYNTRLEALLIDRLGVQFADRPGDDPTKRPVREIVAVDGPLPRHWSSRRVTIDLRRAVLSTKFQANHGRPPTPQESIALAGQANLETRQAKHEPRSYAEQRATWRTEATAVLGGETGLRDYIRGALERRHTRREAQQLTPAWVEQAAEEVLTVVQAGRATWQTNHVRAEAERQARNAGIRLADIDRAVDAVVTTALVPSRSVPLGYTEQSTDEAAVPAKLRRRDGSSVYTVAGSTIYTSAQVIAAEEAIVAAAGRRDGRTVTAETVDMALLESTANGVELNPGQVQMVRELATSGARVQLALAPAGTGKTTAMRVLSRAWTSRQSDGTAGGNVVGLAPSAAAAAVLREEIGDHTDTLAKLIHVLETGINVPEWVTAIGPQTLVVIDEAGMAGTIDLAKAIDYVTDRGGSVRLIGDDQQLAAIGAGGVLRDVANTHGAVTLSQVMRFTHPAGHPQAGAPNHAEGAASLALRDGDTAAIAYYIDNGRVHVGDITTVTDDAYTAWSADRAAGHDAIMLAPTRDLVAELNDRARRDRLDAQEQQTGRSAGQEVRLVDGSHASAGDAIITRKNNRKVAITATDWVKNGDRWRIDRIRDGAGESGALDVTHLRTGRHITLPADYVAENVSLGYACTVHGAQGITADASYTVATGDESRQLLYVAMTRGRHSNHIFLTTAGDGDEHSVITRDALLPPTAVDILTRVLARDGAPVSATSADRAATDPAVRLAASADQYYDALGFAAADHLGSEKMAAIDTSADTVSPGLTQLEAYPALRSHLALMAVDGHDLATVLRHAISTGRGLDDARDVAAVLDWRLDPTGHRSSGAGPLPWLPAVPAALSDSPEWGRYLTHNADTVSAAATAVATQARAWTPTSAPAWAAPLIDRDPALVAELAVWRAANSVEDGDRRPAGPTLPAAADARAQRALNERVTRLLGDPKTATGRWTTLAHSVDKRIAADPYWPTLADRLSVADRAGIDITNLVRAVGAESPLPDEQPAAALWWRLSRHLTPAAMTATDHSVSETLRPDWTPLLADVLGTPAADRIQADPAWPALVAAVTHAGRDGWAPEQLLTTAHELLRSGQPDDEPLRPDELATALVWRIGMLTDTAPASPEDYLVETGGLAPSVQDADLELLGSPVVDFDEDWLASLIEPAADTGASEDGALDPSTTPQPVHSDDHGTDRPDAFGWLPVRGYPSDDHINAAIDEAYRWDTALVSRARIVDLNTQAADFFIAHYGDSWAPDYLADRFSTNLADDDRFTVGYAPDSWTALTTHLRQQGATDEEIVGAGLGSYASTGRVIDRFRDRLVFPIQAAGPDGETEIHGWIGRRNPAKADDDHAGPKYLNTSETDLFTKGHELYGLVENAGALAAGATPVLVEGPMDALAVTLAGDGEYVGVAALGTAFTDTQADALRPYIGTERPGVIVATDADRAGQQAAHRAFWQLAARGDDPRQLLVDDGKDPAELLQTRGPDALKAGLDTAGSLADTVIADRTAPWSDRLDTVEGSVYSARAAAQVVAALPASTWPAHLAGILASTSVTQQTAIDELFDAHTVWSADPHAAAKEHLAERAPGPASTTAETSDSVPTTPALAAPQWATLADGLVPELSSDPGWPGLAASLDRAAQTGYDVTAQLPSLVAIRPLPEDHMARSLELRLATAWPESIAPLSATTRRAAQIDADRATRTRQASVYAATAALIPTVPEPVDPDANARSPQQPRGAAPDPRRGPNR